MPYKKVKTVINHLESQEMVLRAVGFSADEVESIINDGVVTIGDTKHEDICPDEAIYYALEHNNVDHHNLEQVVELVCNALIMKTPQIKTVVTGEAMHAFVDSHDDDSMTAICQVKA